MPTVRRGNLSQGERQTTESSNRKCNTNTKHRILNGEMKMQNELKLTATQQTAVTTMLNLRKLTKTTGTFTTRAQNDILRALDSKDLSAVANALAE